MPDQQLGVLEAEGAGSILLYIGPPRELRVGLAFPLPGDPGKEAACGCELSRDVQMQTGVQAPIWATPLSGLQPTASPSYLTPSSPWSDRGSSAQWPGAVPAAHCDSCGHRHCPRWSPRG